MGDATKNAFQGGGKPPPFLFPPRSMTVLFEDATGIKRVLIDTTAAIRLDVGDSIIEIVADTKILQKITVMIAARDIIEPTTGAEAELPLNCRSTAKWLMRNDKSQASESGMEHGAFIGLEEAKKTFGYPIGIEWSTGNLREDVTPFHEAVILGPVGDDELIFEKPGYSLPYQFSLLSAIEARNLNMRNNAHYLRSFYGSAK